ncbi:MAG TPA: hypothetical protein VNM48_01380 [Chloroflexota bacterium]|nr:hypothetical protein [Chloroflexota bacterium]
MTFRDSTSTEAQRLREERNADGWGGGKNYPPGPNGLQYRCSVHDIVLAGHWAARRHERSYPGCVMLRVDWLEKFYWGWVKAQKTVAP